MTAFDSVDYEQRMREMWLEHRADIEGMKPRMDELLLRAHRTVNVPANLPAILEAARELLREQVTLIGQLRDEVARLREESAYYRERAEREAHQ